MSFQKDLLLYLYWGPFRQIIRRLPSEKFYQVSTLLSRLVYYIAWTKRRRLTSTMKQLMPEIKSPSEKRQIIEDAFRILIGNEMEMLCYDCFSPEKISEFIECEGLHYLDQARSKGKGVILLFAHFGANQMVMPAMGHRGYPMSQLSAPATVWTEVMPHRHFSPMEKRAMAQRWQQESSLPVQHINIFGSLKSAFVCLKKNNVLGVAIDGGWGQDRVPVSFFDKKILVSKGAATISQRLGCPVLPTFVVRTSSGKNRMIIEAPLMASKVGTPEGTINIIEQFVKRLEFYVRRYPGHYLNFAELRYRMALQGDKPLLLHSEGEFPAMEMERL